MAPGGLGQGCPQARTATPAEKPCSRVRTAQAAVARQEPARQVRRLQWQRVVGPTGRGRWGWEGQTAREGWERVDRAPRAKAAVQWRVRAQVLRGRGQLASPSSATLRRSAAAVRRVPRQPGPPGSTRRDCCCRAACRHKPATRPMAMMTMRAWRASRRAGLPRRPPGGAAARVTGVEKARARRVWRRLRRCLTRP